MPWQQQWPAKVDFGYAADITPHADETFIWRDSNSPLTLSRVAASGRDNYRLRLGDWLFVDILSQREFVARARPGTPVVDCEHFIADQVVPRVMESAGRFVIHGAAVRVGDGAILLVGASGRGKSTLSASFELAGCPLMGDDAASISSLDDMPRVLPVYPSLRLLPDSLAALLPAETVTSPVADYTSKRRLPVAGANQEPVPIRAAYILAPPNEDSSISVSRLTIARACMTFVENSFALNPVDPERARARLEDAGALARQVPSYSIGFPRDYACLPAVRQAILDQLAETVQ